MAHAAPAPLDQDLGRLDPANNPGDRAALEQVQREYDRLLRMVQENEAEKEQLDNKNQELRARIEQVRLGETLDRLGAQLTTQAVSASSNLEFSGKAKELIPFLDDVEKHVLLATDRQEDRDLKRCVYQFSKGTVSTFIQNVLKKNRNISWVELKQTLIQRFGEKLDPQTLLIRLRNYTQRPGQSIAVFSELVHKKALDIYHEEIVTDIAQRELVSILAKGLKNRVIAKKIVLEHPDKFTEAVNLAIELEEKEQRLFAYGLQAPRREEAMEVSELRKAKKPFQLRKQNRYADYTCYKCGNKGHIQSQCKVSIDKKSN